MTDIVVSRTGGIPQRITIFHVCANVYDYEHQMKWQNFNNKSHIWNTADKSYNKKHTCVLLVIFKKPYACNVWTFNQHIHVYQSASSLICKIPLCVSHNFNREPLLKDLIEKHVINCGLTGFCYYLKRVNWPRYRHSINHIQVGNPLKTPMYICNIW